MAERIEPAARVYAEALYAAARDAGRTREVDSDLKALISGLGGNRPLVQALANPAIPRDAKKRVLMTLLADSDPLVRNAVLVLTDRGRLPLVADTVAAYAELTAAEDRILTVEVTTAVALDDAQVDDLRERALRGGRARSERRRHRRSRHHRGPRPERPRRPPGRVSPAPAGGHPPRAHPYTIARWE